ncbi:MAG: ion transporter [Gordonibacter sp.]|uniref:ion transporter n=1 Tax=Gordonibacter sp. TaxID=1968902 RepID=UPI002FC8C1F0
MPAAVNERLERASVFKRQAYYALEDLRLAGPVARVLGVGLFVLIVLNAALVFAETQPDIPQRVTTAMVVFGVVSSVCFALEYAARLWVADLLHPDRRPGAARVRYVFSLMGIIDLLSFLPGLLVLVVPVSPAALHAARIIRLVRLVKISRYMRGLKSISRVFQKRSREIVAALTVLALLTVTASVLMYEIEHPAQPDKFDSVFTGMYWAMTTITSTGYGDLVPITPLGRFVGFMTMLLSIGVVAIPAGIFSAGFVSEFRAQDAEAREQRQQVRGADPSSQDEDTSVLAASDEEDGC